MSLTIFRPRLITLPGFAVFLIATSLLGRIAMAGAIIETEPPAKADSGTFDWQTVPSGPLIEFGLSTKDENSSPSDSMDGIQQSYVPWIVQDRRSLDWFGGPQDILSAGGGNNQNLVSPRTIASPDLPPPIAYSYDNPPVGGYAGPSSRDGMPQTNGQLDLTLTKLVAGVFQSLGYVNTIFVLGPILVIALFLGLMHLVRILRVHQGLDPEQGKHRWGIEKEGHFGHVHESNDNAGRSRRKGQDVA
jgi:hypothetical protein